MMNKEYTDKVISVAMANGMPLQLSKLMACQSAFETGNFSNHAFLKSFNGFGYKHVDGAKLQLAKPAVHSTESDYYAAYPSFENSIKEVCLWIGRRQKEAKFPKDLVSIQTPEQYAHLLKACGYYGGKEVDYANGVANYMKQL
jgi:hypothetical protein